MGLTFRLHTLTFVQQRISRKANKGMPCLKTENSMSLWGYSGKFPIWLVRGQAVQAMAEIVLENSSNMNDRNPSTVSPA